MVSVDKIIAFEGGEMEMVDIVGMLQEMINDGTAWTFQGFYGRTARSFIEAGWCGEGRSSEEAMERFEEYEQDR
jgi:hypothetical protein